LLSQVAQESASASSRQSINEKQFQALQHKLDQLLQGIDDQTRTFHQDQSNTDRTLERIEKRLSALHSGTLDQLKSIGERTPMGTNPKSPLRSSSPSERSAFAEKLIRWMAVKSVSFSAVDDPLFRQMIQTLKPTCAVPCSRTLKKDIEDLARKLSEPPPVTDKSYCSLMIDGATKFNKHFLSVLMFRNRQVHFLDLCVTKDQKAKTIGAAVKDVVNTLKEKNYVVTAVCTDNASNEKAMLDPKKDSALQVRTGLPLFRVPCTAHTANLAVHDFLEDDTYQLLPQIKKIIAAIPTHPDSRFATMPRLNEGRWFSLAEVTLYLTAHFAEVRAFLQEKSHWEALNAFDTIDVGELNQVMNSCEKFLKKVEANQTSYFDIFLFFRDLLLDLVHLSSRYNRHSMLLFHAMLNRFKTTTDLSMLFTCFAFTEAGRLYYNSVGTGSDVHNALNVMIQAGMKTLSSIFQYNEACVQSLFSHYLAAFADQRTYKTTEKFWDEYPKSVVHNNTELKTDDLVDLARRVQRFPATEAGCERLFCNIRNLVGDFRQRMTAKTIRSLLRIRMDELWKSRSDQPITQIANAFA
jgi:hypothetical protein